MKTGLIGGIVLCLALHAEAATMQVSRSIDELYQEGQVVMAADWKALGRNAEAAVFIHNKIRKEANGQFAVWTDHELPLPRYFEKERPYLSMRERMLVNCKSATVGIADTSYYAKNFGAGMVVGVSRESNPVMLDVVPDSIEDQLVKIACAPKPLVRRHTRRHSKRHSKPSTKSNTKANTKANTKSNAKPGAKSNTKANAKSSLKPGAKSVPGPDEKK